jgi:hypothetical protein
LRWFHLVMSTVSLQSNSNASPPGNALRPFTRTIDREGRIIREYSGILPCTKHAARHILRCEHLRDIPGEPVSFYKQEDHFTHQIWVWYRELANPSLLQLLFRSQFECAVKGCDPDAVATAVTDDFAQALWQCKLPQQVYQSPSNEEIWEKVLENALISFAHAQEPPTLYQ